MSRRRTLALLITCILLILAAYPVSTQDTPEATPAAEPAPIEMLFGSGPFNLMSPQRGLADFASYRAALTLSFDGTRNSQPEQWSRTYAMLVAGPAARQLTIDNADDPASRLLMAEVDGIYYEQRGETPCSAATIEQAGSALADSWEPASFLSSIIGADEAGAETVGGIETNQYSFDEQALGLLGIAEATGDVWVAVDSGALVRLVMTITGGADYFGPAVEGTLTWDYELADVNGPLTVELPIDCVSSGIIDIPMLPDATDILQFPGMTTYSTQTDLVGAAAFYADQVASAGGELPPPVGLADTTALIELTQDDQRTSIILIAVEGGTLVELVSAPTDAPANTAVDAAPATITVQVEGGGTVDIPLPPGATDVANPQGILTYFTATEQAEVAAFYEDRLLALGGQVYTPLNTFAGTAVVEITLGDYLLAINIMSTADGSSVFIRVDPPGTFSPLTALATADSAAPADAPAAQCTFSAEDIPMLPDASGAMSMAGTTTYATATSSDEVTAFYTEQLAASGWDLAGPALDVSGMAAQQYMRGGQVLTVSILPMGGITSIYIVLETVDPSASSVPCTAADLSAAQPAVDVSAPAADCTVSSASGANQREGPGTAFALVGTLAPGTSASVSGQATGTDGFVWWQLREGGWVRSDVVAQTGDCDGVPVVQQ